MWILNDFDIVSVVSNISRIIISTEDYIKEKNGLIE